MATTNDTSIKYGPHRIESTADPIRTEYVYPPIPDRSLDWAAYRDEEGLTGRGQTEHAAIADLIDALSPAVADGETPEQSPQQTIAVPSLYSREDQLVDVRRIPILEQALDAARAELKLQDDANVILTRDVEELKHDISRLTASLSAEVNADCVAVPREPTETEIDCVAMVLCEEDGRDPHNLIWQGRPPEPYGEEWHLYRQKAKAAIRALLAARPAAKEADGWIPWGGGECPVAADVRVDTKTRDPLLNCTNVLPNVCDWNHWNGDYDILFYRPSAAGEVER